MKKEIDFLGSIHHDKHQHMSSRKVRYKDLCQVSKRKVDVNMSLY